jgi:hypothetical protein
MRHVWQSSYTNPALVQSNKIVVSVSGIRNNLTFDGPTYDQIVTRRDGKSVIEVDSFIRYLDTENTIRDYLDLPTLNVAVRFGKLTLSMGHSVKYVGFFTYPKTLPQLIWQGNAQFIGQDADLGNDLQVTGYHELGLGVAYKLGKFTLGARGKLLNGIADATTDPDHGSASLYTDPDVYQITLKGDYILHTSNSVEYESYKDFEAHFDFGRLSFDRFFSENKGFALDLGLRFETEKLDLAASLLDLGGIRWEDGVTNYAALKNYEYDGLDFSSALTGDEIGGFDEALDTIEALFQVEKSGDSYSNKLPRKVYLSALFKLNEKWSLGGLFFNENFREESFSGVAVGANAALFRFLTLGATYGVKEDSYNNLGLNLTLKLGPVQAFAVADNIFAAFDPGGTKNFSIRVGGNLVIK